MKIKTFYFRYFEMETLLEPTYKLNIILGGRIFELHRQLILLKYHIYIPIQYIHGIPNGCTNFFSLWVLGSYNLVLSTRFPPKRYTGRQDIK